MYKVLLLLLVQVFSLGLGSPIPGKDSAIFKRQVPDTNLQWTLSSYSECTVSCGGGLKIRSVRCLDADNVISRGCNRLGYMPASYKYCNQVDCVTNNTDSNLYPSSSVYNFARTPAGLHAVFHYQNESMFRLNNTEFDNTVTVIDKALTSSGERTTLMVYGANNSITFKTTNNVIFLQVDGANMMSLNGAIQVSILINQTLSYQDNVITILHGAVLKNITMLIFYDSYKFYSFDGGKMVPLKGPGALCYNPTTGLVIYSTITTFNIRINEVINSILAGSGGNNPMAPTGSGDDMMLH